MKEDPGTAEGKFGEGAGSAHSSNRPPRARCPRPAPPTALARARSAHGGAPRTRAASRLAPGPLTGDVMWAGLPRPCRAAPQGGRVGTARSVPSPQPPQLRPLSSPPPLLPVSPPLGPLSSVPSALRGPRSPFLLPGTREGEDGADLSAVDVAQLCLLCPPAFLKPRHGQLRALRHPYPVLLMLVPTPA